jgi:hypothetical protein
MAPIVMARRTRMGSHDLVHPISAVVQRRATGGNGTGRHSGFTLKIRQKSGGGQAGVEICN